MNNIDKIQQKGFNDVFDVLLRNLEINMGFIVEPSDIKVDDLDINFIGKMNLGIKDLNDTQEVLQKALVVRPENVVDTMFLESLHGKVAKILLNNNLIKTEEIMDKETKLWNMNRNNLMILNHTHQILKFEEIAIANFKEVDFLGYSKKELFEFFKSLSTRRNMLKNNSDRYSEILKKLDMLTNKDNFVWRSMRLLMTIIYYGIYDDASLLADILQSQMNIYMYKSGDNTCMK